MIEHGIFTSQADVWAHLFPFEESIYVYRVSRMRWWINYMRTTNSYKGKVAGYSKNGKATGLQRASPKTKGLDQKLFCPEKLFRRS